MNEMYNLWIVALISTLSGIIITIVFLIIKSMKKVNNSDSELKDIRDKISNKISLFNRSDNIYIGLPDDYTYTANVEDVQPHVNINYGDAQHFGNTVEDLDNTLPIKNALIGGRAMLIYNGNRYMLSKPKFSVGRSFENDIVINGSYISKTHFIIYNNQREYCLKNVSLNGVIINGKMLYEQQCKLKDKDCIEIPSLDGKMIFYEEAKRNPENGEEVAVS